MSPDTNLSAGRQEELGGRGSSETRPRSRCRGWQGRGFRLGSRITSPEHSAAPRDISCFFCLYLLSTANKQESYIVYLQMGYHQSLGICPSSSYILFIFLDKENIQKTLSFPVIRKHFHKGRYQHISSTLCPNPTSTPSRTGGPHIGPPVRQAHMTSGGYDQCIPPGPLSTGSLSPQDMLTSCF